MSAGIHIILRIINSAASVACALIHLSVLGSCALITPFMNAWMAAAGAMYHAGSKTLQFAFLYSMNLSMIWSKIHSEVWVGTPFFMNKQYGYDSWCVRLSIKLKQCTKLKGVNRQTSMLLSHAYWMSNNCWNMLLFGCDWYSGQRWSIDMTLAPTAIVSSMPTRWRQYFTWEWCPNGS